MKVRLIPIVVFLLMFAFNASAQFLSTGGEVVEIVDGKTVVIAIPNGRVKVELQFVEVPEPGQPMHDTVKAHLQKLLMGKVVEYKPFRLFADRTVGRVTLNNVDVSQQMLRDGAAWLIPINTSGQDKNEHSLYSTMETAAKGEKRGVWSMTGLKPAWEFRAEKNTERSQSQNTYRQTAAKPRSKQPGYWGDVNPLIGDVGALSHGYNAGKRLGYVSTMFGGVEQTEDDKANNRVMALDITYHYKEDTQSGRDGLFVITVISNSNTPRFARNNDLILMEEKPILIGKAKRTVSSGENRIRETLTYTVQRSAIEKLVNGTANLSIGGHLVQPRSFAYSILHNMLQISGKTWLASAAKPKR
jgi:endonuclease YncB( thermonuclease family)